MMKKSQVLLMLALALATPAFAADFQVIANPSVPTSSLTKSAASAIFLKKTAKWEDGTPITVVDQMERSPVREAFTTFVHGKSVAAIKSFWQQQIFSGRDVPPLDEPSDSQVLALVHSTKGAVGYISTKTQAAGVKVIDVH
jgi:ABC-type phosphate transport system substrate-binding protein